jgi:hypothetical protein
MYRRKSIKITVNNLNEILNQIRDTFERSAAPAYLKRKLSQIHPIFEIVNAPKWQLYGQAYLVGQYAKKSAVKKRLKLKVKTHPTVVIDETYFFCILQINKGSMHIISHRGLRYLVAHELAHILQIVADEEVDGQYSYSTALDHDEKWVKYTKWMGGTATEIIPFKEIWV